MSNIDIDLSDVYVVGYKNADDRIITNAVGEAMRQPGVEPHEYIAALEKALIRNCKQKQKLKREVRSLNQKQRHSKAIELASSILFEEVCVLREQLERESDHDTDPSQLNNDIEQVVIGNNNVLIGQESYDSWDMRTRFPPSPRAG